MTFFCAGDRFCVFDGRPSSGKTRGGGQRHLIIALASNVARITATGVAYYAWGKAARSRRRAIYHDLAGWLMMPLAMIMLLAVMKFLKNLWVEKRLQPARYPSCSGRTRERVVADHVWVSQGVGI